MDQATVVRVADEVSAELKKGTEYFKAFDAATRGMHLTDSAKSELRRLVGSELGKRRRSRNTRR